MTDATILRASDITRLLSISTPTLYRWLRAGLFPPGVKFGPNVVGWEKSTVEAWLAQKKASSAASK
jgi:prophage regulatory protein